MDVGRAARGPGSDGAGHKTLEGCADFHDEVLGWLIKSSCFAAVVYVPDLYPKLSQNRSNQILKTTTLDPNLNPNR